MSVRFSQSLTAGLFGGLCVSGLALGLLEPVLYAGNANARIDVPHPLFALVSVVYSFKLWRGDLDHPADGWTIAKTALKALVWPLSLPCHFVKSFGWASGMYEVLCLFATAAFFAAFQAAGLIISFRFLVAA